MYDKATGKTTDLGGSNKFKAGDKVVIIDGSKNKFGGPIADSDFCDGETVCVVRGYETLYSGPGGRGVVVDWDGGEWYVDEDNLRLLDHYDGKVEFMSAKSAAFEVGDRVVVTDEDRADDLSITVNDTVGIVIAEEDYDGDYRVHFDSRDDWYYIPGDELAPAPVDSATEAPAVAETFAPSASHLVADVEGLIAKYGIDKVEATLRFLKSL